MEQIVLSNIGLLILNVIGLILLVFVIFRIGKAIFSKHDQFYTERIFAFCVAFILYGRSIVEPLKDSTRHFIVNIQNLIPGILNPKKEHEKYNIISFDKLFDKINFFNIGLAIVIFFLLFIILKLIFKEIKNDEEKLDLPNNRKFVIYNLVLISILAFSLFLVVSVCITIPYFRQSGPSNIFTLARLENDLNTYSTKDSLKLSFGQSPSPLIELNDITSDSNLNEKFANLPQKYQDETNYLIQDANKEIIFNNISRDRLRIELDNMVKTYIGNENKYKGQLKINFEKQSSSLTTDLADLFTATLQYFSYYIENQRAGLNYSRQILDSDDSYNTSRIKEFKISLKNHLKNIGTPQEDSSFFGRITSQLSLSHYNYNLNNYNLSLNMPKASKDGSEWGFFGKIARYLITTQSQEMVLLVGMFGFGLLGASIFSFHPNPENADFTKSLKSEPIIDNFGGVLIRGCGAAIIVYLATKAGLAVFSAGSNTDANGYILLLSCFVGAVYSDKVWKKIKNSLYPDDDKKPG